MTENTVQPYFFIVFGDNIRHFCRPCNFIIVCVVLNLDYGHLLLWRGSSVNPIEYVDSSTSSSQSDHGRTFTVRDG